MQHHTRRAPRQLVRATGLIMMAAVAAATWLTSLPATADPSTPAPPQLSIAVDNGQDSAAVGDHLRYAITVTNLGAKEVRGLRITQSVPSGAKLLSADSPAKKTATTARWDVDLQPTKKKVFHSTMTVAETPEGLLRLASVVCASINAEGPPLVCASDSDQLPAGAAQAAEVDRPAAATSTGARGWIIGGGAGLVAIVATVVLLAIRRRNARTPAL